MGLHDVTYLIWLVCGMAIKRREDQKNNPHGERWDFLKKSFHIRNLIVKMGLSKKYQRHKVDLLKRLVDNHS